MKNVNWNFSKDDTLAMKGIAIMVMLYHHCFLDKDRFAGFEISFWPLPENIAIGISAFFKICVGMFVFLSAYGMTISLKNKYEHYNFNKNDIEKSIFNRYFSLMSGFIFNFLTAVLLCYTFRRELVQIYQDGLKGVFTFFMDMFGVAYMLKLDTLIGTWWYMGVAIIMIFLLPILLKLYKKYGYGAIVLSLLLPRMMNWGVTNLTRYLLCIMMGIWFADENNLMKIKNSKLCNHIYLNKCLKLIIEMAVMVICLLFRRMDIAKGYMDIFDSVIPVAMICFCNEFIIGIPFLRKILIYFGVHSMNIFMLHTLIRVKLLRHHIYSFKSAWLVVLVLLLESLALSMIVECLKKVTRYNKLVDSIRDKGNHRLERKGKESV
ncbi:acyltransferase [Lachnospiraceae bacterium ZAX-1]